MALRIVAGALAASVLLGASPANLDRAMLNNDIAVIAAAVNTAEDTTAIKAAMQYIKVMPFSRQGLIDQLSSEHGEGYTVEEATEAVDMLEQDGLVDWDQQAISYAKRYLDIMPFSRKGLIKKLSSIYGAQFTDKQAETAVKYLEDNELVDWNEQASLAATKYMEINNFSKEELLKKLSGTYGLGFTEKEADYAIEALGL